MAEDIILKQKRSPTTRIAIMKESSRTSSVAGIISQRVTTFTYGMRPRSRVTTHAPTNIRPMKAATRIAEKICVGQVFMPKARASDRVMVSSLPILNAKIRLIAPAKSDQTMTNQPPKIRNIHHFAGEVKPGLTRRTGRMTTSKTRLPPGKRAAQSPSVFTTHP